MADDDLLALDLRSFALLGAIEREGSFTAAADRLGLSQSVVSYGVDKLRLVFDDPLFVRIAGRTQSTERCRELIAMADRTIADFQMLRLRGLFDPATTTERLTIACNYYERMLIVPRAAAALSRAAPGLKLEIVDASGAGHDMLLDRAADLLIGPFQRHSADFYTRRLVTDHYACLMDPDHPAAAAPLTLDAYLGLDHILVTYGGRWQSGYVTELDRLGQTLRPALKINSPAGIEELVRGSALVATLPSGLARKLGDGLRTVPCPFEVDLRIQLVWTAETHHSDLSKWARDLIAKAIL